MKQMKGMMGGKADELEMMAQSMDPDGLAKDMAAGESDSPLGPNPFAGGGNPLAGIGGAGLPGLGGMGGGVLPSHGGTKKNRKKKKR